MTIGGWARGVGFSVLVAFASGCSGSATLRLRDGREVRGKIVRRDQTAVYVEQNGEERHVLSKNITDVTHPGNEQMVAGVLVLSIAGFLVYQRETETDSHGAADPACNSDCADRYFAGAALVGSVGLGLEMYGLGIHLASRSRYAPPEASPPPAPMQGAKGISLGFEF